jgi:hypothetical protein
MSRPVAPEPSNAAEAGVARQSNARTATVAAAHCRTAIERRCGRSAAASVDHSSSWAIDSTIGQ